MDLEKAPKTILDQWMQGFIDEFFFLGFRTGSDIRAYLLRPQVAKAIADSLSKAVKKYEDEHGKIDMTGYDTGIPSPLQREL